MHVQEKFEIGNDTGLFVSGFHRRLGIKRVSPQRVKPGSFESVDAKVDGDRALFSTTEDGVNTAPFDSISSGMSIYFSGSIVSTHRNSSGL